MKFSTWVTSSSGYNQAKGDQHLRKVKLFIGIILFCTTVIIAGIVLRFDRFGWWKITWVDCLQIDNVKYYSEFDRTLIDRSNVGDKIGRVKFNVSNNVRNPNYIFRNGDATFLDVGTEIYSVKSNESAVGVIIDGELYLYEMRE